MLGLGTFISAVKTLTDVGGAAILHIPEIKAVVDSAVTTLHHDDQPIARETLDDLLADTEEHRARVREKLRNAVNR